MDMRELNELAYEISELPEHALKKFIKHLTMYVGFDDNINIAQAQLNEIAIPLDYSGRAKTSGLYTETERENLEKIKNMFFGFLAKYDKPASELAKTKT